ncbi:hypothetical protein MBM_05651 [Drepanopeziza brunnea f. sp. 'multigermtubi' MB_m1]|uniref:Uncharacterized protein n=1 Tax=Marssonina brunnea f. sp. multigermtubi (strain MB_m1) TaxID=1072389 RepID=K1WV71_MARBU|nr:uncharacterized protein MBM_05651 [Drepanopeziza brunnea f. sp. 'multigermtubi' MB_m1]EKD16357.1 hypothetical protein MBM_05651 [Drepanopeziza brunnea f. sp. 'multigermtubi' MB_m1]
MCRMACRVYSCNHIDETLTTGTGPGFPHPYGETCLQLWKHCHEAHIRLRGLPRGGTGPDADKPYGPPDPNYICYANLLVIDPTADDQALYPIDLVGKCPDCVVKDKEDRGNRAEKKAAWRRRIAMWVKESADAAAGQSGDDDRGEGEGGGGGGG